MGLCGCPVRGAECTSLVPLPAPAPLSPGAQCLGGIYFGVFLGRADLERVCLSQSSFQRKYFSPLTLLALFPTHWGQVVHGHPPLPPELAQGSSNTAPTVLCALSWSVVPTNSLPLGKTTPAPPLCLPGTCTIGKMERRLRNRVIKGFKGLAKLQKFVGWVMWLR